MRIVLAGAGALGSAVLYQLTKLRPAWLTSVLLVDPDQLEERNIALSRFFQQAASSQGQSILTKPKAEVLSAVINDSATFSCEAEVREIADVGWQRLREADMLLCCADDPLARLETAQAARALGLPLIDIGVFGGEELHRPAGRARVTYFAPDNLAACQLCGLREDRRAELLSFAATRSPGCRPLRAPESLGQAAAPPPAIEAAATVVTEIIEDFISYSESDPRYRHSWTVNPAHGDHLPHAPRHLLTRSISCPWHEDEPGGLIALEDDRQLGDSLHAAAPDQHWRIQLAWPVCMEAQCRHCGTVQRTAQRLAALRRSGGCMHCGVTGEMEPRRIVSSLGTQDAEASLTPMELGLPRSHMARLRRVISLGSAS
ncbi:hypothetical protein GCM10011586_13220 [Silvibacterium dinghuense]|nr:hypothetical protein GCM10011586_13220 [Silvibacterium dinghuense]